jgi:broad specificity phosphatase PhoE
VSAAVAGLPRLYLVRHGETEWSRSGQHTSHTDLQLTERGEEMARELAPFLRETAFAFVWTSLLQRARQTCALAGLGRAATIEPELAEWEYGDYEGRTSADIRQNRPGWNIFKDGCPGGETPGQISDRADRVVGRLRALEGNIAVFTHGQFGCVLAARWIGLAVIEGQHFSLDPASLSVLGPKPGHPELPAVLRWNFVAAES